MSHTPETPFDNIESSHEYMSLLAEAIEENRLDVEAQIVLAIEENANRRKEALLLVSYKIAKLSMHMRLSENSFSEVVTLP
jgi:hypothetical protein